MFNIPISPALAWALLFWRAFLNRLGCGTALFRGLHAALAERHHRRGDGVSVVLLGFR